MSGENVNKVVEQLKRAQARREKRLANMRTVYTYRHSEFGISDNLILLPTSTELSHKDYLLIHVTSLLAGMKRDISPMSNYELVCIGRFDKLRLEFTKSSPKVLFSFSEAIKNIKDLKK